MDRPRPALALLLALIVATPALSGCMDVLQRFQQDTTSAGERAGDFITDDRYSKLLIEVDHVPGDGPHQMALDQLKSTAEDVLDKDSVEVALSSEIPGQGQDHAYTWQEIAELEADHRDNQPSDDTMVLYVLYVDGGSQEDDDDGNVLGAAYRGSSFVMFKGNIREASCTDCGVLSTDPQLRYVERAVIVHELGHILGLVNNGIPMQTDHEDDQHPHHSEYQDSVMHWAVETSRVSNLFDQGENIPYRFDQYDEQDIRAVREGEAEPQ